jgi:hypothetical protein
MGDLRVIGVVGTNYRVTLTMNHLRFLHTINQQFISSGFAPKYRSTTVRSLVIEPFNAPVFSSNSACRNQWTR